MTPQQLTEIRQRVEAASPGPWMFNDDELIYGKNWGLLVGDTYNFEALDKDFIAHARQDIPALLQYCEELEKQISADDEKGVELIRMANKIANLETEVATRTRYCEAADEQAKADLARIQDLEARLKVAERVLREVADYDTGEQDCIAKSARDALHQLTAKEGKEV